MNRIDQNRLIGTTKKLFLKYYKNRGIQTAFQFLDTTLENLEKNDKKYLEEIIILDIAEGLRFEEPKKVREIERLFNKLWYFNIDEFIIKKLLFKTYSEISLNGLISKQYRKEINENLFKILTRYYYNDKVNNTKVDILCILYIKFVLEEIDLDLFNTIIFYLYKNNKFSDNPYFKRALTYCILGLYTYSFREGETLDEKTRIKLKQFLYEIKKTKYDEKFNLKLLVQRFSDSIILTIADIIFKDSLADEFEYKYINFMTIKNPVWTEEMKIGFMLSIYLIYGFNTYNNPVYDEVHKGRIYKLINEWEHLQTPQKYLFLNTITNSFLTTEGEKIVMTSLFKESFQEIKEWLKVESLLYLDEIKAIFLECNKEYDRLKKINVRTELAIDERLRIQETNKILSEKLTPIFGYSKRKIRNRVEVSYILFETFLDKSLLNEASFLAESIKNNFLIFLSSHFKKTVRKIYINYYKPSLQGLVQALKENEIDVKTGELTKSIDFKSDNTINDYLDLQEFERTLKTISLPYVALAFLNSKKIKFSAKIKGFMCEELQGAQLENYIKQFEVGENYYLIDNIYYNREKAEVELKNKIIIFKASVAISTNFDLDSGIQIEFQFPHKEDM